jgi:hypothetical protein
MTTLMFKNFSFQNQGDFKQNLTKAKKICEEMKVRKIERRQFSDTNQKDVMIDIFC